MTSLITHLHAFVREVELTETGMDGRAIQFLTATGKKCDDKRQEYILLSDTLGVSMLVDAINHRKPGGATETTVLGPFYVSGARDMPIWADIAGDAPGEPAYVSGRVLDVNGKAIAGAVLDVWQTDGEGFYDVQRPGGNEHYARGQIYHGSRRPLRISHGQARELSGAYRWTGRQNAARHGPASVSAGARARHCNGAGLRARSDAFVREGR
jgi:protocatechuate 3,4-dioxygenase beta subunit